MPPTPPSANPPGQLVTAVLVSHDGSRWLPECLAALTGQRRPPQRVVAVDTGSTDGSADILTSTLGDSAVLRLGRDSSLATAVQSGLDACDGENGDPPGTEGAPAANGSASQWLWILHDDCAPAPDALANLLAAAESSPSLAAVAPKVLSWDGRRLLEVGLTIDSSGRIRTGLEPREVDQGQHDDAGDVLAAGTAGLLVRRDVWDRLGGLDPTWPLVGEDVDLGWRMNAHGERLRVAPAAIVRHAAAIRFGQRPPDAVGGRTGAVMRRNGMQVVLANTATWLVPLLVLRYLVENVCRAAALLLFARRPGAAADEMIALGGVLAHPGVVLAARRRRHAEVPHREIRHLLARPGLRRRAFVDRVAETFGGRRAAEHRRSRRAPVESGPVADEAQSIELDDAGMLARAVRQPGVLLVAALTVLGVVAARGVLGGDLHGGRLLPAPPGAGDLWSLYLAGWHAVALGTTTQAPPSLAVLAAGSTVLLGKPWLLVSILLIGAMPLAGWSAYAASRGIARSAWLRVWAAVVWAVLPAATGAVAGGRVDVVVVIVLLPLLARAIAAALTRVDGARHLAVGAGLLLALTSAFAPVVWVMTAVALLVVVLLPGTGLLHRLPAALVVLVVPVALLLPWDLTVVRHPRLVVAGMGLPETFRAVRPLPATDLLLLHPGGPAQPPLWVLGPLLVALIVGVSRARGGPLARAGLLLFAVGETAAIVITHLTGAGDDPTVRYWTGVPLAVACLGVLAAALVAGDRARPTLRRHAFGWRQPAAVVLAAAALAGTATAVVGVLARGVDRPLTDAAAGVLPVFAAAEADRGTSPRLLVLRSDRGGVRYAVVRHSAGLRLGDADVADLRGSTPAGRRLDQALSEATAGQASAVPKLAEFGVSMLVVPGHGGAAVQRLADVDGLDRVPTDSALVWRSEVPTGELVLLTAQDAKPAVAGADLPADAKPVPLPARAGHARAIVPSGAGGRLLVLAERADSHWQARLDGQTLAPTRAYGWAQAWRVPASGGRLEVSRVGDHRQAWLWLELGLLVVALALSSPAVRHDSDDALDEAA